MTGTMRRGHQIRTGDRVVSPSDGRQRMVAQVITIHGQGLVRLVHGPHSNTVVPLGAWVRVVRPRRVIDHDKPAVVHATASRLP